MNVLNASVKRNNKITHGKKTSVDIAESSGQRQSTKMTKNIRERLAEREAKTDRNSEEQEEEKERLVDRSTTKHIPELRGYR